MNGMVAVSTGNWPSATEPEMSRVWPVLSSAMEVRPAPGTKVEKVMPSPAGVSLVRKPEGLERMSGTSAATVGKPVALVWPAT